MGQKTSMLNPSGIDSRQFGIFRILLGLYLLTHLALIFPHSMELFSNQGVFPHAEVNLSYGYFPNPLYVFDSPFFVSSFVFVGCLLSVLLTLGVARRIVCISLWFILASLFHRNNFTENPALYYTGWTLLALSLTPRGEHFALFKGADPKWQFSSRLYKGAWFIMGLSYTVSGIDKFLESESWRTGYAVTLIAQTAFAKQSPFLDWFLASPEFLRKGINGIALYSEIFFLPLIYLSQTTRFLIWLSMLCVHCGTILVLFVPDLTVGIILFHIFTFDRRWLGFLRLPLRKPVSSESAASRPIANRV